MIVVTAPTGQIGSTLVCKLLARGNDVQVIVRYAARLDDSVRKQFEIVEGSHDDPAVLDAALRRADAVFWLVPPNPHAPSAMQHYLAFARASAAARPPPHRARGRGVQCRARVGEPGRARPASCPRLSPLAKSDAAYRGLSMPFYMENLLGQLDAIQGQGAFSPDLRHIEDISDMLAAQDHGVYDAD